MAPAPLQVGRDVPWRPVGVPAVRPSKPALSPVLTRGMSAAVLSKRPQPPRWSSQAEGQVASVSWVLAAGPGGCGLDGGESGSPWGGGRLPAVLKTFPKAAMRSSTRAAGPEPDTGGGAVGAISDPGSDEEALRAWCHRGPPARHLLAPARPAEDAALRHILIPHRRPPLARRIKESHHHEQEPHSPDRPRRRRERRLARPRRVRVGTTPPPGTTATARRPRRPRPLRPPRGSTTRPTSRSPRG